MTIKYCVNKKISAQEFLVLLEESSLAERRPVDDLTCIEGMISNSNLIVSAWHEDKLVGIARSVTDFHYACYLSDLAVSEQYQGRGVGKQLQILTQEQLGSKCKMILIAAPKANAYYSSIGFTNNSRCWVLQRDESLG